jgi:hypothetical protein
LNCLDLPWLTVLPLALCEHKPIRPKAERVAGLLLGGLLLDAIGLSGFLERHRHAKGDPFLPFADLPSPFEPSVVCVEWSGLQVAADALLPAPGSSIRRTGPSGQQTIEAKTYGQNAPAAPKPRLSDRTTQPSTQPSTSTVIFEPAAVSHSYGDGNTFSVGQPAVDGAGARSDRGTRAEGALDYQEPAQR